MPEYRFSVLIEHDSEGYVAFCPELQGCYSQSSSYEEVAANIRDAIRLQLEDRLEAKEEIPQADSVSLTQVAISI